jgi:glucose-1-phosphate thymidylyltransferase
MIYYPIRKLVDAGVTQILIVAGGRNSGDFLRLLSNGKEFGLRHLDYTYQDGEGGIADALRLAEDFADGEKICVILGDNILEDSIRPAAQRFAAQPQGAHILLKSVPHPEKFGVPVFDGERIIAIQEKPSRPASQFAVTGIYFYDATVFQKIAKLKPSGRGELEITDVNNAYLDEGTLTYGFLEGWWTDAGSFETLRAATNMVADHLEERAAVVDEGAQTVAENDIEGLRMT